MTVLLFWRKNSRHFAEIRKRIAEDMWELHLKLAALNAAAARFWRKWGRIKR